MINAKNELRYLLTIRLLESAAQAGLLTPEELSRAKLITVEKYLSATVWESSWLLSYFCGNVIDNPRQRRMTRWRP